MTEENETITEITWEQQQKEEKLKEENQYLEFRRRIINEVLDTIFTCCTLTMIISTILVVFYYFGFFSIANEGEATIPILVIIEQVWLHLQSLPIQILLLIIIFIISSVLAIIFGSCYIDKSEIIVLGEKYDKCDK